MSKSCNQVVGSLVNISIVPNLNCSAAPVTHQVITTATAVGATQISLALDSTFVPASGAYTASSRYALTPGTILQFGSVYVEVTDTLSGDGVYFITTTAQQVNVKRLTAPIIAANLTASTYFAIKLCLKSSNITTNTTQVDNTTNCTGALFTQVNVGYMQMLDLAGFVASKDYGFYLLQTLGKQLQACFFLVDYNGRFSRGGIVQLTDPSITEAVVKQLVGFTVQGQVQSISSDYGSYLTAAQLTAANAERTLYGFAPAIDTVVLP
jgi:hypothetical protein